MWFERKYRRVTLCAWNVGVGVCMHSGVVTRVHACMSEFMHVCALGVCLCAHAPCVCGRWVCARVHGCACMGVHACLHAGVGSAHACTCGVTCVCMGTCAQK